jgi:hypothetical protein
LALSIPLSRFTPRVGGGSAFYVRHPKFMNESTPQINRKQLVIGYIIMALSVVSLPSAIYLFFHPEACIVPPSFIVLPMCMFGVGADMAFQDGLWRHRLRWTALLLLVLGSFATIAVWFVHRPDRMITHQEFIGFDPGQFAPQNIMLLVFLVLLFLHTSHSVKIRRISSLLFWLGFSFTMLYFLMFDALRGLGAMLGE